MTINLLPTRDDLARALAEDIIARELNSPAPKAVSVSARDNHSGEPALYIYVLMPSEAFIPKDEVQDRLIRQLFTALQQAGDDRFPHVFYGPRGAGPAELSKSEFR